MAKVVPSNLIKMTGKKHRRDLQIRCNNVENPNQSICSLSVASYFDVQNEVKYLHTIDDIVRAVRKKYSVRSIRSYVHGRSVGAVRSQLKFIDDVNSFIVMVENHVLLLDKCGKTIVDTDPRKRDKRPIWKIYGVYNK